MTTLNVNEMLKIKYRYGWDWIDLCEAIIKDNTVSIKEPYHRKKYSEGPKNITNHKWREKYWKRCLRWKYYGGEPEGENLDDGGIGTFLKIPLALVLTKTVGTPPEQREDKRILIAVINEDGFLKFVNDEKEEGEEGQIMENNIDMQNQIEFQKDLYEKKLIEKNDKIDLEKSKNEPSQEYIQNLHNEISFYQDRIQFLKNFKI